MDIPKISEFEQRFNDRIWLDMASEICRENGIGLSRITRAEQGENIIFIIDDKLIVKIYRPDKNGFDRELIALKFVKDMASLPTATLIADGEFGGYRYLVTEALPGRLMTRAEWLSLGPTTQIALVGQLAEGLKELHTIDASAIQFDWDAFLSRQLETVMERQRLAGGNPEWLASLPKYIETYRPLLSLENPSVFMHGDVHFGNLRIADRHGEPIISGLFDFADSLKGSYEYEFVAVGVLMIQGQGNLQREFFRTYGYRDDEINIDLRHRLMLLTILYEHSSLKRYAERLGPGSEKLDLEELESAIWNFA